MHQSLPKFVGYRELESALGISRRTIERMVREGRFPKPTKLSPGRVGWELGAVTVHLANQGQRLEASAVSKPEQLAPDELIDQAVDFIAEATSIRYGAPVSQDDIASVHVSRIVTEDEFRAAEAQEFAIYAKRFENMTVQRSFILASWLFASLRPYLQVADGSQPTIMSDPEALARLGAMALDDESWAEAEVRLGLRNDPK